MAAQATRALVASAPVLLSPPMPLSPDHAIWRIELDREVTLTFASGEADESSRTLSVVYVPALDGAYESSLLLADRETASSATGDDVQLQVGPPGTPDGTVILRTIGPKRPLPIKLNP
jgi:hypothetical protein